MTVSSAVPGMMSLSVTLTIRKESGLSQLPDPASVTRPWCNAYPPGVPPRYAYPVVPLTRFLDDAARDFPVGDALQFRSRSWTWSQLRDLVDRAAAQLADLGLQAGDRLGLITPTTPAAVVVSFAAWRLGAVLVPLDPSLATAELADRLRAVEPTIIVTDMMALDAVDAVRDEMPGLRHVVATDPLRWLTARDRLRASLFGATRRRRTVRPDDDVLLLDTLLVAGPALVRQAPTMPDTHAAILFTGGTTGLGRGVVLTHGNLVANAFQQRLWVPDIRSGHEVVLGALPLWHVFGLTSVLLTGALAGAKLVLVPRPDAGEVIEVIQRERPTLFPGVPRLYQAIADHPAAAKADLSSIRVAVSGGAPLAHSTIGAFERLATGARLRQGYGQSETSPLTHASPVYGEVLEGGVGLPVTDTVAIIRHLDDPEQRADADEVGELLVSGPQVMAGYWAGAGQSLDQPGMWHATGDLATVTEDGRFRVLGRLADLINRDGHRIIPDTLEAALLAHPAVARAVVVGVPAPSSVSVAVSGVGDVIGRDQVVAVVVPRGRARVTSYALEAHLAQLLDPLDLPDAVVLRRAIPESLLGKVLRRSLRIELAAERATRDHELNLPDEEVVG